MKSIIFIILITTSLLSACGRQSQRETEPRPQLIQTGAPVRESSQVKVDTGSIRAITGALRIEVQ